MTQKTKISVNGSYKAIKYISGKEYAELINQNIEINEIESCENHPSEKFLVSRIFKFDSPVSIEVKDLFVFPSFIRFYYENWCFELSLVRNIS